MNVYLGMPCGGSILPATAICLAALVSHSRLHRLNLQQDTYCDRGHNAIVEGALAAGSDAILFLDSDQEFPPHTLDRFLSHRRDIVGAAYRMRQPPFDLMPGDGAGLAVREWIPSGVMLVRRRVFEKVSFPWFQNLYGKSGEDFVGSDRSFCRKARAAGFEIFCDYDISRQVTHIASLALAFDGSVQAVGHHG